MGEWFFVEQQSLYRQQTLRWEVDRHRLFAQVPQSTARVRLARLLVGAAMWLAPGVAQRQHGASAAARRTAPRPNIGILGS